MLGQGGGDRDALLLGHRRACAAHDRAGGARAARAPPPRRPGRRRPEHRRAAAAEGDLGAGRAEHELRASGSCPTKPHWRPNSAGPCSRRSHGPTVSSPERSPRWCAARGRRARRGASTCRSPTPRRPRRTRPRRSRDRHRAARGAGSRTRGAGHAAGSAARTWREELGHRGHRGGSVPLRASSGAPAMSRMATAQAAAGSAAAASKVG